MNAFDKLCAACAFALGVMLAILGLIGTFVGCGANFKLPPVLGVIPLFFAWGILKPVYMAWTGRPFAESMERPADPL